MLDKLQRVRPFGRELAGHFALNHPDSVSNLIRRAERAIADSKQTAQDINRIDKCLD
jgi:hypothetical protein